MPEYLIVGSLEGGDPEELDTAKDKQEAEYLVGEYKLAFGKDWKIWTRKGGNSAGDNTGEI